MKVKYVLTALSVLCTFGLTNAQAHDMQPQDKMRAAFEQADTNQDGKISAEEFRIAHEKRGEEMFKKMDANGDGFIDEAERKAFHEKMREHRDEHHKEWKSKSKDESTLAPPPASK